ncbi:MAG: nitroreductase family protein [Bdellovibrionales bacterium]|nr:nitroreductase family protein [Bdellovibrionales bacterium]
MEKDKESVFNSVPEFEYQEKAVSIDAAEFVKLCESRRSVRVFENAPIPEDVVEKCLDLAMLAPNSSNLQPWEFYWPKSADKKRQVVEACLGQPAASTAAEIIVVVARTKTWKKHARQMVELFKTSEQKVPDSALSYYEKIVPFAYTQGPLSIIGLFKRVTLFFLGFFRPIPREPVNHQQMILWASKTAALACENLMLAFRAFGYDTCPMEGLDSRRMRKILGLPRDAVVVMAIGAGQRSARGVYGPRIRFPRDQFIKRI